MMVIEETPVPAEALPVEAFKAHLRLGSGFDTDSVQDAVLESFLRAAVTAVEARTSKALFERAFLVQFHEWKHLDKQPFGIAPVSAVTAMTVVDTSGQRTEINPTVFWLERDAHMPLLRAKAGQLPSIPSGGFCEIAYVAGYGASWEDIPADLRQAVLLLAAHYYEYRNETGLSEGCMPFGVTSLIARYRVMRLYGGGAT